MLPLTSGRGHFNFLYTGTSVLLVVVTTILGKVVPHPKRGGPAC